MSLQAAPSDRIGAWVLGERVRRDRFGEVFAAHGPAGAGRLRLTAAGPDPDRLADRLGRLRAAGGAGMATLLDLMVDAQGRAAVVTPADLLDLDRRVRGRRRLDAGTLVPLGAVLLDALARLHARGLVHGAVGRAAVGIDAEGRPHWVDAGLAAALAGDSAITPPPPAEDVARCAAMLRDLGRLPVQLEAVVDPVAAGSPGATADAAGLAAAWRGAAAAAGLAVPPPGSDAALPGLLPPPPRRRRLPAPPGWLVSPRRRPQAAAALVVLGAGFAGLAWVRGSGSPLAPLDDYLPARAGLTLSYRLSGVADPVTLRVDQAGVVAGVYTVSLVRVGAPAGATALPLGLAGATLRTQDGSLVRTASDGIVRDLVTPLAPGSSWSDRRSGVAAGIAITETRTLLGAVSLVEPAGRFDRCAVVSLASASTSAGGPGASAAGTAWLCPGVGLARAVLRGAGAELDVDLLAVR